MLQPSSPSSCCSEWGYANADEVAASIHNRFKAVEVVFEGMEGTKMKHNFQLQNMERGRNKRLGLSITGPSSEPVLRNQAAFAVLLDRSSAGTGQ